ncbi:MAG TPA: sodium:calcium antiporter [Deltaproteobacteria bacterium]|nr:sodium:calcium antiporter [Deltaproteobacteria bacterium]HOI07393.1 sodium:calcium antiporter [Deltaproteobacteria bacterium]
MALTSIMTFVSLGLILLSCYVFVNAVEQAGEKLNLHQGIIGSILAAVGTALPETIIPIMAILITNTPGSHQIGIGAIAGAPFMLSTLALFVTGAAVVIYSALGKRTLAMSVDINLLRKDLTFFLVIYGIAVLTTFVHNFTARSVIAVVLMLSYGLYLKLTISADCQANEVCEPLYLSRLLRVDDHLGWVSTQLLLGLGLIIAGSHLFIGYVEQLSVSLGVSPLILSIIITPIVTELPEKVNSIIWVGRGKDTLALGNITGAMVFQSCFPVVFGILFTPWNLAGTTMLSAMLAFGASLLVLLWITVFKRLNPYVLLVGGLFYASFIMSVLT